MQTFKYLPKFFSKRLSYKIELFYLFFKYIFYIKCQKEKKSYNFKSIFQRKNALDDENNYDTKSKLIKIIIILLMMIIKIISYEDEIKNEGKL